ncbi:hypothetical protein BDZ89DRAFT_1076047 [Hymenopellis radicata]|nr:hypothetical protein BDZ89DRAFT_1076047 [Hymenopellis radicata]
MSSLGIADIPPELLGDIFYHCAHYCPDAPVMLSMVCKRFRGVALSTPRAWTSLRLSVSQRDERDVIRKAGLWLSLAGACCVDLYIDIEGQTTSIAESHQFLVAFLQHNTARIGYLNPGLPAASAASSVFHSLTLLPQLKSLQLTNHLLPSVYTPDLHNLQALSVVRPLRAPPLSLTQLLQIIQAAPCLHELEVSARVVDGTHPELPSELYLPTLKRLSLRTNRVPLVLEAFILPALEELRINDLDGKRVGATSELVRSLEVLNSKLLAHGCSEWSVKILEFMGLTLHWENEDVQTWEWCLGRMNRLEDIYLTSSDEGFRQLARFFTKNYGESLPCPVLHTVHLNGSHCVDHANLLKERRPGVDVIFDWSAHPQRPWPPVKPRIGRGFGFGFGSRFAAQRGPSRSASPDIPEHKEFALVPEIEDSW